MSTGEQLSVLWWARDRTHSIWSQTPSFTLWWLTRNKYCSSAPSFLTAAMVVALMVAEKPSLARSLAEILSHKQYRRRKSSCSACDVYEFEGQLPVGGRSVPCFFKMTSVCGHVMSLDFQPQYNNWERTDPVSAREQCTMINYPMCPCVWLQVDLFDAETVKKEAQTGLRMCHFLRQEVWY